MWIERPIRIPRCTWFRTCCTVVGHTAYCTMYRRYSHIHGTCSERSYFIYLDSDGHRLDWYQHY